MQKHEIWISKANRDLTLARKAVKDDDENLDGAVFHCQQCAEKVLKAYLVYQNQHIIKSHDRNHY